MSQGPGPISAAGIGLFGTGSFVLGTTVNSVGPLGLRVNLTGPGASVAFTSADRLVVDNSSVAAGIKTAGGDVTLKSGSDFRAEIPAGAPLDTVMIDLGTGKLDVVPGLAGKAKVVFNVEVKAAAVTLGTDGPVNTNSFVDSFSVRPSANVAITVNGNAPFAIPGDALSVITFGTNLLSFTLDPNDATNGQYTFDTRQPITFTSIEQFGGLQAEGFVVQVNDPVTADFRTYSVRFNVSFRGDQGPGIPRVQGSATPANSFIVSPQLRSAAGPFTPPQIAFGDVNGDGIPDFVFANGQDSGPLVTVVDGRFAFALAGQLLDLSTLDPRSILAQYNAFEPSFLGGVSLAVGDLDGDGTAEIVTGAGVGGAPRVRVVGYNGNPDPFQAVTTRADFFGYEPTFRGGVNVAVGDTTADGSADIVLGTGFGGGPRVRILDGQTYAPLQDFFAYEPTFRGGVLVGAGQFDVDGKADVVTGPGFGGGPRVRVFRGTDLAVLADFFAFPPGGGLIGGDATGSFGVGGVAFGRLIPNSGSQQAILVASPRGSEARALAFAYDPLTLEVRVNATDPTPVNVPPPVDLTLRPVFLPGGSAEIVPDVRTLRDAVSVAGFVSPII
jgi:hypothetical protein